MQQEFQRPLASEDIGHWMIQAAKFVSDKGRSVFQKHGRTKIGNPLRFNLADYAYG
jgi:hypothetical protein